MSSLRKLVDALRKLPGVGPKSAQRMAYQLLKEPRQHANELALALQIAIDRIQSCLLCNDYSEENHCDICKHPERQQHTLCVVERPSDVHALEQSQLYQGRYFVLHGKISPLDGIGPDELPLQKLKQRVQNEQIREIILAFSHSPEAQVTAYFIQELLKDYEISITQLAYGIPSGGDLELLDAVTLGFALKHRASI